MKNKALLVILAAVPLLLIVLILAFLTDTPDQTELTLVLNERASTESQPSQLLQPGILANAVGLEKAPQDAVDENDKQAPFFEAETKARLIQIAHTFSEDIQYPDYSKPIRNEDELQKYLPNQSVASSLDLNTKAEDGPSISVKASKLQYFRGEDIFGKASIFGITNERVSVDARLVNYAQVIAEVNGLEVAEGTFLVSFEAEGFAVPQEVNDLRLVASFDVNGQTYEIGTPIQYEDAVASIDYVADAQVNDTFLEIPVYLTTLQPGYHQISANLYNADNGQALVHLSADKELLVEKDFILLKAHIAALKAAGHEGPYFLDDLSLIRMPSPPNFATEFGKTLDQKVTLRGYPFADYRDEPYVDEQAQERLEFLTKLGGE